MPQNSYQSIQNISDFVNQNKENLCIFKHSTTCPISAYAKQQVDSYLKKDDHLPVYMVTVQTERPLSNEIAQFFQIKHESPQMLVLKEGTVQIVLNHHQITVENIESAAANL